jgi:hypothetical protein
MNQKQKRVLRLGLLLTPVIALVACPGEFFNLNQYAPEEIIPWNTQFETSKNVCLEGLCQEGDTDCLNNGTDDEFSMAVNDREYARGKYVFFEECPWCARWDAVIDGGGTLFRTSGTHETWGGFGTVDHVVPLRSWESVGHLRRYDRGACSTSENLASADMHNKIANDIEDKLEDLPIAMRVDISSTNGRVLLGSEDCGSVAAGNRDFISIVDRFRVEPVVGIGYFDLELHFYWRFVAKKRYEYLTSSRRLTPCDRDRDCAHIIGATCDMTIEDRAGYCANEHTLDVADFHMDYSDTSHCENYSCRWRRREVLRGFAAMQANIYRDFYSILLNQIREESWQDGSAMFPGGCARHSDCDEFLGLRLSDYDFSSRCNSGACELAPNHIYDVNLYPNEMEFNLARDDADVQKSVLELADLVSGAGDAKFCDQPSSVSRIRSVSWY